MVIKNFLDPLPANVKSFVCLFVCLLFNLRLSCLFIFIMVFAFILQRLEESIEKRSPTLGRDAVYTKTVSLSI